MPGWLTYLMNRHCERLRNFVSAKLRFGGEAISYEPGDCFEPEQHRLSQ